MEQMTIYDAARRVVDRRAYMLLRPNKEHRGLYDVTGDHPDCPPEAPHKKQRRPSGYMILDVQTAHAIVAVHDALTVKSRKEYLALPLERLIKITWKCVG